MTYRIKVEPSGHEFLAEPQDTVLEAALKHGYLLPYGCRNGRCGNCKGLLLEGSVTYPSGKIDALQEEPPGSNAALLCQAVAGSDLRIQVREIQRTTELEVKTLPCRVVRLEHLADDVMRICLKLPESQRMQFLAGQYIDFVLRDGRLRAFSIANAPHDDEFIELHVRHVPGGEFTGYVFDRMKEKAIQRIRGPLGTFYLREDDQRPVILMGGGTGFAPLKAIVEHAFHIGFDRPIHLYWGVRALGDLYLDALPRRWARERENFQYTPVLSEPKPEDNWQGRTGWVHEAVLEDYDDLHDHAVYMSGPPPMIEAARRAFFEHGLEEGSLYYDSFEYAADQPDPTGI